VKPKHALVKTEGAFMTQTIAFVKRTKHEIAAMMPISQVCMWFKNLKNSKVKEKGGIHIETIPTVRI
jgi:hypothetical protein